MFGACFAKHLVTLGVTEGKGEARHTGKSRILLMPECDVDFPSVAS